MAVAKSPLVMGPYPAAFIHGLCFCHCGHRIHMHNVPVLEWSMMKAG